MQETWVQSLDREDPLKKGMTTHSSIFGWRIPWTEELGGLQSVSSQIIRHNWETNTFTFFKWQTRDRTNHSKLNRLSQISLCPYNLKYWTIWGHRAVNIFNLDAHSLAVSSCVVLIAAAWLSLAPPPPPPFQRTLWSGKGWKVKGVPKYLLLPGSPLPALMKALPGVLGCSVVKARLTHDHLWQKGKHHHYQHHHHLTKADPSPVSMLGPGSSGWGLYWSTPLRGLHSELCTKNLYDAAHFNLPTNIMR